MDQVDLIIAFLGALALTFLGVVVWLLVKSLRFRDLCRTFFERICALLSALCVVFLAVILLLAFLAGANILGFVLWAVLIVTIEQWMRKRWAVHQNALLWLLTVSAERSMPLVPAVEAFAKERGGRFGRLAQRLAAMLKAGDSLPDAVCRCRGVLPADAVPMIRIGCDAGDLPRALRMAAAACNQDDAIWMSLFGKIAYLLAVPVFGMLILVFLMLKIIPSFQKIFLDFGVQLPQITQWLIKASCFTVNYWFLFSPLFLLGLGILIYMILRYYGWTYADPPLVASFVRRLDAARVLDALALGVSRQRPLPECLATLAESHPKRAMRWRLQNVVQEIRAGGDWCESLRGQDLIRQPEFAILQAAQRVGNLPWAMREMAESGRRRLVCHVHAFCQGAFPPIMILMGLAVGFIVVALFMPLVCLIQRLT